MSLRIVASLLGAVALSCGSVTWARAAGFPVSGVAMTVAKDPQGSEVARFQTDGKGEFTLKELAPGRYTIFVSSQGIARDKARSGTWVVTLLTTSAGKESPSTVPVIYATKEVSGGLQAAITVPAGPPRSFRGTLSH
ncbi:hypothetical protein BH11PSE3_BH11PSE3_23780 [soil metagenome]